MTVMTSQSNLENQHKNKLYLIPTTDLEFGLEWSHPKFAPIPSSLVELPDINHWSESFVISVLEVWSGRRSALQLNNRCHRKVINQILRNKKQLTDKCQIRKIYLTQPIEGVIESIVTLKISNRVRSLILRFEGVDKRWICTELNLL